jgi:hypothetical protein
MNYKIIVEPEAQLDIENSFFYYKNKVSLQVAKQFKLPTKRLKQTLFTKYELKTSELFH